MCFHERNLRWNESELKTFFKNRFRENEKKPFFRIGTFVLPSRIHDFFYLFVFLYLFFSCLHVMKISRPDECESILTRWFRLISIVQFWRFYEIWWLAVWDECIIHAIWMLKIQSFGVFHCWFICLIFFPSFFAVLLEKLNMDMDVLGWCLELIFNF